MRLALADVKKAITRRAGDVYVAPRLLRPREHTRALAALIALHEEHADRTRAAFPSDRPAELIGDYRLARCLMTSLGEWYAWESPVWPGPASPAEAEALAAAGIASPVDLRLALYDAANASGRGYLPSAERPAALDAFAASVGTSSRSHLSAPGEGEADRVRGTLRARRFAEDAEEEKRRLSLPGARGETGLAATTGSEGEPEAGGAADGESGGRSVGRARGISRATLDALLVLDRDERAVLRRITSDGPTPAQLATRYNQLALEAMLAAASTVEWVLPVAPGDRGARSAALKRVCFLARRMGVYYDVAFEEGAENAEVAEVRGGREEANRGTAEDAGDAGDAEDAEEETSTSSGRWQTLAAEGRDVGARQNPLRDLRASSRPSRSSSSSEDLLVAERPALYAAVPRADSGLTGRALRITLYGPQEVMGAANQYGERLARLCRALLGYRRPDSRGRPALGGEGLRGSARVYLHGRPLTFPLDESLLALLDFDTTPAAEPPGEQFDSALEERLFAEFTALERAGEAHGWHVEREPEPLVAGETIYLPDFAFTRGQRRVYLELAGYWRPEYRERKVRKLLALRGRMSLVVAVPAAAREVFAALDGAYPLLFYGARPSATALLALLDREYDDAAERLAAVDWQRALERVERAGRLAPDAAMAMLGVVSRAELPAAQERLVAEAASASQVAPEWIAGVGLCTPAWRAAAQAQVAAAVGFAPEGRMLLPALREQLARDDPALAELDDDAVEALARLAGLEVRRDSIFAAEVLVPGLAVTDDEPQAPHERAPKPRPSARRAPKAQPKPRASRTLHDVSHKPQSLFADSESSGAGEDAPETTRS